MKFTVVASLAFIGAVAAQNSTTAATGCVAKDNACRASDPVTGLSANQAQCSAENAQCQGDCYAALGVCQTTRGPDGLSANQAACIGQYATCLGENPIAATGGIISSFLPYSATASVSSTASATSASASASATGNCVDKYNTCRTTRTDGLSANQAQCAADNAACQGACYASYNTCRTTRGPDGLSANQAQCASNYASCLGENPIASTGGLISSFIPYSATASSSAGSAVYTTQVVTAITTVCPAPTAGPYTTTIHTNVYTVSSATTITITDCPCTVSSKVPATSTGVVTGGGNKNNGTATASKPVIYTGAAVAQRAGMGFLGVAAGAVMLL